MESEINSLPIREVLLLVLLGGLIQLGMYLISTYILPVLKKKRPPIGLFWERSQIVLWGIFALFSFSLLFRENMYLTLAATGLILALSWSFWVNFFAGLTIKFTNQFRAGNHVSTDLAEGKIQAIKMSFTEVINSKGELIVVPNRLFKNAVLKHINQKNKLKTSIFICSGEHNHNKVYNHAINCPFISGNQKITISKNPNNTYEIKAMLLDDSFLEEAVAYFENLK